MKRTLNDAKIDRIRSSWLRADQADATWLASIADESIVATTLVPGHHAYLGLDHSTAGLVVAAGTPSVELACPTHVLALTTAQLSEAARRIPAIADAWAAHLRTDTLAAA